MPAKKKSQRVVRQRKPAARRSTGVAARKKAARSEGESSTNGSSIESSKKRAVVAEDLQRLQIVSDPQISPDGSQILFTKRHVGPKNNPETNLWIVAARNGAPRQFTASGKDRHARWSPDGRTIALIAERDDSPPQIYTIPAEGGEATPLTGFPEGTFSGFLWSPDGRRLAVAFRETAPEWTREAAREREETGGSIPPRVIDRMFYRLDGDGYFDSQRFQLYCVDVATGEHRMIFDRDSLGLFHYDWAPDSSELVVTANTTPEGWLEPWKVDLFRVEADSGRAAKIPDVPVGRKGAVAWSPDGQWIAFAGRRGKEIWGCHNTHLVVCRPDGTDFRDLTEESDYCLRSATLSDTAEAEFDENILWSPDSRRVFMNFGWKGGTHVFSVGLDGSKVTAHTRGRRSIAMGNLSADGRRMALTIGDQLAPPEAAIGEFSGGKNTAALRTRSLSEFNRPLLDEIELIPAEPHWVPSTEGAKVHTWVMKPPGFRENRRYPAVLQIHGGPHAQYGEAFFHEFQLLAAAGYVVVYSNPRGSKGYGETHCNSIRGDWGKRDWEDIQAVTRFMQEQPWIDNRKLGIMGGSYGGYMTNWAIGHSDDYAGAITDRCVSNLVSMVGSSDIPLVPDHYWPGNSWDNIETIWEQSPLKHFGNVMTPTLIIHSEGDLRCNVEQSEQVFAALKLRGIPTRFVRYPRTTSHGMSRQGPTDLRIHRLGQILEWWDQWLQ